MLWSLCVWKKKEKKSDVFVHSIKINDIFSSPSHLSDNQSLLFVFKGKHSSPAYLLGLNCAVMAAGDGCDGSGFCGFELRSEMTASRPFLRIGAFPSLRMIPGPSLPRVSDGAQTSNGGGPGRQLDGT